MEIKKITRHAKQQFRRRYGLGTYALYMALETDTIIHAFDDIYQVDFYGELVYPVIDKKGVMRTVLSPEIVANKIRHYDYELEARRYTRRPMVESGKKQSQRDLSVVGC